MQRPRERLGDNIPLFRSRGGGLSIEAVSRLIDDSAIRLFRPEPRLVHDRFFVASEAEPSKLRFEVVFKHSQMLAVGSRNEIMEEVSVSGSWNMGSRVGVPRPSIQDNDVLGR